MTAESCVVAGSVRTLLCIYSAATSHSCGWRLIIGYDWCLPLVQCRIIDIWRSSLRRSCWTTHYSGLISKPLSRRRRDFELTCCCRIGPIGIPIHCKHWYGRWGKTTKVFLRNTNFHAKIDYPATTQVLHHTNTRFGAGYSAMYAI